MNPIPNKLLVFFSFNVYHFVTIIYQGHDTTTATIEFLLYNLARFPEVQQKVFDEARLVFGDRQKEPITTKKLNELKYFDLVLKESLRIFPAVPFIGRQTREDVVLSKFITISNNITANLISAVISITANVNVVDVIFSTRSTYDIIIINSVPNSCEICGWKISRSLARNVIYLTNLNGFVFILFCRWKTLSSWNKSNGCHWVNAP